jgi:hypothetical protein
MEQETKTYNRYYGVRQLTNGRWVVLTGDTGRPEAMRIHYTLDYAKREFALKKAERFIKVCNKPFTDFLGRQVTFNFIAA